MFRELPASRPVRSFRRGEWTGLIGASVLHASLLLIGGSPSRAPAEIAERDTTIPIVFPRERHPSREHVVPAAAASGATTFARPSPLVWPDGAIPEIDLDPGAVELDLAPDPRDMVRGVPGSGPVWASLSARGDGVGGVARESALDLPLRVERAPEPTYPEWLRRVRITGRVTVEFVVDTTGRVETATIEVIQATHEEFAAAVIRALEGARFSPGTVRGRPVRVKVRQDFRFRIGG